MEQPWLKSMTIIRGQQQQELSISNQRTNGQGLRFDHVNDCALTNVSCIPSEYQRWWALASWLAVQFQYSGEDLKPDWN